MNFKLTEEQDLIRKNIREFCVKNVEPVAAEIDEKEAHPAELFSKLAEGAGWASPSRRRTAARARTT